MSGPIPPASSPLAAAWSLDPAVTYLNHGSFGAAPRAVLARQAELAARLEREPERFFGRDLEGLLDGVRGALGAFAGADPDDLAPVSNATGGVNTVLRSLDFRPGDELLTTNHAYNACANALDFTARRTGARVVRADVPFPLAGPEQAVEAVLARLSERTRLVLLDHVTSPTGFVLPVERLVPAIQARGVDVLVDGAHAPGMLPLDLRALGAAYYTGNCHKWLCAPKGAGFLHVRRDRQEGIHPLTISHGASSTRGDRSRFRLEFDWGGTVDPTAWLCVPTALEVVGSLVPGGWPEVMARNHALAVEARRMLAAALDVPPPCPESMLGSLAAVRLPDGDGRPRPPPGFDTLQDALLFRFGIEVPINAWPRPPHRWVRVSAQLYNAPEQYAFLGECLRVLLGEEAVAGA
ncbi:MAG TPA: aminotransferase class V-fold PLP-dependent enzyme [Myxococcaceae bacterium]|nr:aminotransferase class V-fold PLP-dependent enzyme [Myxococcaceae bacterium]